MPVQKPIAKPIAVDPRAVWPHEAADFTPWLAANLEYLTSAIGLDVSLEATEVSVGPFRVDIKGSVDGADAVVIVENQLEATNHGHLGQLLTYAAGLEAKVVVWIATSIHAQHQSALRWLNEITPEGYAFYGIELEAFQLADDSPVGVRLNPVVRPDTWVKVAKGAGEKGLSPTEQLYFDYWTEFLPEFHARYPGWSKKQTIPAQSWIDLPSGRSGVFYAVNFVGSTNKIRAELYIDPSGGMSAKEFFAALEIHRLEIDEQHGGDLSWEPLENRRACRVAVYRAGALANRAEWPDYRAWMISEVGRLRAVIQPFIDAV